MKYMFWWECFECFFCKNMFCPHWKYEQRFAFSSLGKSDQSSVHVHDWISFKKVTKVPLMNVNWTWIERKKFSSYNALLTWIGIYIVSLVNLLETFFVTNHILHENKNYIRYDHSMVVDGWIVLIRSVKKIQSKQNKNKI